MQKPTLNDVLTDANLVEAWVKVRANEGAAGVDGETIADFEKTLMHNLDVLAKEVRLGTYRPRPLLRVEIEKPSGGMRGLSIPAVRDRVLQTAVTLVLTPLLEEEFEDVSYAYRKGRSVDQAVARVERLRDQGYTWVVDADILSFFDHVDHKRMLDEVSRFTADADLLKLIKSWLKAKVRDGKKLFRLQQGLPQGSPLSPLLANLYLDRLDDELLGKHLRLVRFADDFLVLCRSRKRAENALKLTEEVLNNLKLEVNEKKTQIVDFDRGFKFLGVRFIRSLAFKTRQKGRLYDFPRRSESFDLPQEVIGGADSDEESAAPTAIALAFAKALGAQQKKSLTSDAFAYETAKAEARQVVEADKKSTISEQLKRIEPESSNSDPRLRTLYIFQHGCVLRKTSERLLVSKGKKILQEIPAIKVDQIMVFGNSTLTLPAMKFCLGEKIPIILLSSSGRYHGMIDAFSTDPVLLHREQFRKADDAAFCLEISRSLLDGKLANSRLLLQRQMRRQSSAEIEKAIEVIKNQRNHLQSAATLEQLRGHEGAAAKAYFSAMANILSDAWDFPARKKRPPTDPVNALLSYGYTLLFYNVYSLLRARGLNPHIGYLHPLRAGHPALASDLMEEFRALIVDAVVLNLLLNQHILMDDFLLPQSPSEACTLTIAGRKKFIRALENKFNTAVTHPLTKHKLDYRRCIEAQVQHFAAVVRDQVAQYQPLVMR